MHLFFCLLMSFGSVWADPAVIRAPKSLPVKAGPAETYKTLFFLVHGEQVVVLRTVREYARVKVIRAHRWRGGYVLWQDLKAPEEKRPLPGGWAFGGAFAESRFTQNGKTFQTEDEVSYTTSKYSSQTGNPFLVAQYGRENFWRVWLGLRSNQFNGTASTDIAGASVKSVSIKQSLFSLILQKTWGPIFWSPLYAGVGFELARGTSQTIQLGGVDVPTSDSDLPLYIGLHLTTGLQVPIGRRFSLAGEIRGGGYLNQSTPVFATEAVGLMLVWF